MMKRPGRLVALVVGLLLLAGCEGDGGGGAVADPGGDLAADAGSELVEEAGGPDDGGADLPEPKLPPPETLGGARPAAIHLPAGYDGVGPYPLVILLHGFSVNGTVQDLYFGLSARVGARQFIEVVPEGTKLSDGRQFWNASPACCDLEGIGTDDVGYLSALAEEAVDVLAVDRVYLVGHSNGAFMAYRMICERPELFAGIAGLAGAAEYLPGDCAAPAPSTVLHVHGTDDDVVWYEGEAPWYPGARESVERWAGRSGCDPEPVLLADVDLDTSKPGAETTREVWRGCEQGTEVALWTIPGGVHIPPLQGDATDLMLDFLFAHRR